MKDKKHWIDKLNLSEHIEGGFFREVYRSHDVLQKSSLPERFKGDRVLSTSIYYLVTGKNPSKFHKVMADEIWHFFYGSSLRIHLIDKAGKYDVLKLGLNIDLGEEPTVVVPHQVWMAAEVVDAESYGLVGCTTAPGFEYEDFIMADIEDLLNIAPEKSDLILKFT